MDDDWTSHVSKGNTQRTPRAVGALMRDQHGAVPRSSAAYAAKIPVAATAATMNYSSSPSCLIEASALTLMNVCEPSATVRLASPFVPSFK